MKLRYSGNKPLIFCYVVGKDKNAKKVHCKVAKDTEFECPESMVAELLKVNMVSKLVAEKFKEGKVA